MMRCSCAGEEDTQAATEQQAMEVDAVDDDIMIIEKPAPAPTEAPASSGTTVAFAKYARSGVWPLTEYLL